MVHGTCNEFSLGYAISLNLGIIYFARATTIATILEIIYFARATTIATFFLLVKKKKKSYRDHAPTVSSPVVMALASESAAAAVSAGTGSAITSPAASSSRCWVTRILHRCRTSDASTRAGTYAGPQRQYCHWHYQRRLLRRRRRQLAPPPTPTPVPLLAPPTPATT